MNETINRRLEKAINSLGDTGISTKDMLEMPAIGIMHLENKTKKLVACKELKAGSVAIKLDESELVKSRDKYTIERDGKHYMSPYGKFANHSCDPSAIFKDNELVLVKDVGKRRDITFDYHTTESVISTPFDCKCGSINCRGRIE